MALSWWHQWVRRLASKGRSGPRKPSRRMREKLYRRSQCERLEDRTLLAANLFLQSIVTNGPNAPVGATAASDTLMVGGELPVQFTTPAGFLNNGFSGGTFYFAYDTSVFSTPAPVTSALTKSLTPAQSAEINIGSNSVLSQSPGTAGFQVNVSDALISGSIHRVTVSISNGGVNSDNVTASTGGVLFAINLQPTVAATSTNLCLYNYSTLSKTDSISDKNAANYTLGLPTSLTQTYNAAYDFQANVIANTLPTLALGGPMNTASGAVAPIPPVPTTGGTATVYANIASPDPAGNGLYNWTVVLNYDPTQFTLPNPTFGGDLQLGTVETANNGSGGNGILWTTGTVNQENVSPSDEEVLASAFTLQTTPVSNTYFGSLFSITFHVNTSTATPQTSYIHLLASTTSPGYPQTLSTTLSGAAGNQTFSPSIPNGSLDAAVTLPSNGPQTSTTVTSSNPSVTYGTPVTFTAIVSADTGSLAPSQGNVDFTDQTNAAITLGDGTFAGSSGTTSTWTFTTGVKTFNFTTGDAIVASYSGDFGFNGSNGSTVQIVNKAPLTITAQPNTKTYDGTASAAATPTVVGLLGSDRVTGLGETYDTKNAGTGKTLTVAAGYVVSDGNGGNNYTLDVVPHNNTGVIDQAPLRITALANTKTYDATTSAAAVPTVAGLVSGDTVTGLSETYDTKNAGTGKTLTVVAGYVVSDGNGGNNYTLNVVPQSTTGVINQTPLTIAALPNTKTYDTTTSAAAVPTVAGLLGSDTVTGLSETYDNQNAGTSKTLTVAAGYTVSDGNSGGNYTVTTASSAAGVINQSRLTITALANTKTYDGTTSAAAVPTVAGLLGSDTVTGLSETYNTNNAGTGKTLTVAAGYVVNDGNRGGNYTVTFVSNTRGVIDQAPLTITALPNTKVYDGTTCAAAVPTVAGLEATDTVTGLSETYDTPALGTGKTLMVSAGYIVSDGNGGNNYAVTVMSNMHGVIIAGPVLAYAPLAGGALSPPCGTGAPTVSTFAGNGISDPEGLAFDAAGNLYVANDVAGTISKVTPAGAVSTFVSSGIGEPRAPAFDAAGNLYVISYSFTDGSFTISKVTPAGAVSTFFSRGLEGPTALAFDAAGNLYVVNGNNTIPKVTPAGAASTFVSNGLDDPLGLAFDAAGNLYVANNGNNTIFKVTPAGAVSTFVGSGLEGPQGLAFDAAGNLYVANYYGNTISEVTPEGAVSTFVSSGLSGPGGLAFDAAGNLYVANGNNTISKVTPAGAVSTFVSNGLVSPLSLAFDAAADLYLTGGNDALSKVTPTGAVSTLVSSGLDGTANLAFDAAGNLFTTGDSGTISKVTPAGVVSTFVTSGLDGPGGLAFDAAGNLYVANAGNNTISKVTPAGAVSTFVSSGLDDPAGLAFDAAGNLYVANYAFRDQKCTISKVTPAGAVSTFVSSGLDGPGGLAFDAAGNLYVANWNNTISKVTPAGVVSTFVSSGLDDPEGLAFDAAGNLYVANNWNNTISKVTPAGAVSTFVSSGLYGLCGLAFDAAGNLYVANAGNNTISKVTPAGAVSTFVSSGLNQPEGLAFDAAGNLYVANGYNSTISKVTPAGAVSTFVSSGLRRPRRPGLRRRRQPLRRQREHWHDLQGDARRGRLHLRQQRAR